MKKIILMLLTLCFVFISGCITVHQVINEDGTSNIEFIYDMGKFFDMNRDSGELEDMSEQEIDELKREFVESGCDDFHPDDHNFRNARCTTTEDYKMIISGEINLLDSNMLEIKESDSSTTYIYDLKKGFLEILEIDLEYTYNEGPDVIDKYIIEMPGKIYETDLGVIENNKVVIDMKRLRDHPSDAYIRSKMGQKNNYSYILIIVAVIAILVISYFFIIRKNKNSFKK